MTKGRLRSYNSKETAILCSCTCTLHSLARLVCPDAMDNYNARKSLAAIPQAIPIDAAFAIAPLIVKAYERLGYQNLRYCSLNYFVVTYYVWIGKFNSSTASQDAQKQFSSSSGNRGTLATFSMAVAPIIVVLASVCCIATSRHDLWCRRTAVWIITYAHLFWGCWCTHLRCVGFLVWCFPASHLPPGSNRTLYNW